MKEPEQEHVMPQEAVDNIVSKMQIAAICDPIRREFTACSPVTHTLLTPEAWMEIFTQYGITAGERGVAENGNPYKNKTHLTEFGHLLRSAWERGRKAGHRAWKLNKKEK